MSKNRKKVTPEPEHSIWQSEQDNLAALAKLESAWKKLVQDSPWITAELRKDQCQEPLISFMYMSLGGKYPPPEVLLWVANRFTKYFELKGEKSLDEVFFERPQKKTSRPSYLVNLDSKYHKFQCLYDSKPVYEEMINEGFTPHSEYNLSLIKAAEVYVRRNAKYWSEKEVDAETFLRGYRRWKKRAPTDSF